MAGPLGSTDITPLRRYYGPSRCPLAFNPPCVFISGQKRGVFGAIKRANQSRAIPNSCGGMPAMLTGSFLKRARYPIGLGANSGHRPFRLFGLMRVMPTQGYRCASTSRTKTMPRGWPK